MDNLKTVTIGSRESQLAMVQTHFVRDTLQTHYPNLTYPINGMTTTGDQVLDVALNKVGTKSLFTKELEVALMDKSVDIVVHSLKDLPTVLPQGLKIGAIMERENPADAVVMSWKNQGKKLADLPKGSVVGTSSVRRTAQLKRRYPHLLFQDVRGNLNTRIKKLDADDSPYSAIILAYAGLTRLGWDQRISEILPMDTFYYAVGQGALAVECREEDTSILKLLQSLEHEETTLRCLAERALMRKLEGGCSVPLAVCSDLVKDGEKYTLRLRASVCSLDGTEEVRDELSTSFVVGDQSAGRNAASALGAQLGETMLGKGAAAILARIK
ncbi:hypothetical protein HDV05_004221 [Chytridiales sp. JEL 0842]|nr:hypothetical protein HDV05_004221 [Chytridiales sp. JEL 0842]